MHHAGSHESQNPKGPKFCWIVCCRLKPVRSYRDAIRKSHSRTVFSDSMPANSWRVTRCSSQLTEKLTWQSRISILRFRLRREHKICWTSLARSLSPSPWMNSPIFLVNRLSLRFPGFEALVSSYYPLYSNSFLLSRLFSRLFSWFCSWDVHEFGILPGKNSRAGGRFLNSVFRDLLSFLGLTGSWDEDMEFLILIVARLTWHMMTLWSLSDQKSRLDRRPRELEKRPRELKNWLRGWKLISSILVRSSADIVLLSLTPTPT